MKYEWENRLAYAKQVAEDIIRNAEDGGMSFLSDDRKFLAEEIVTKIRSVILDVREDELKKSGKW